MTRIDTISDSLSAIEGISLKAPLKATDVAIEGSVEVTVDHQVLCFEMEIYTSYPFQFHDQESIRFLNKDLIAYNHVNRDGSICLHTQSCPELGQKLAVDIDSLKQWIRKYYINKENDTHYEHIIVPDNAPKEEKEIFLFTDVDYMFKNGEYGFFSYTELAKHDIGSGTLRTNVILGFGKDNISIAECEWSDQFKLYNPPKWEGLFIFIGAPPVVNKRFAVTKWSDIESLVSSEFLSYLSKYAKSHNENTKIVLLLGYRIDGQMIHWQATTISAANLPVTSKRIPRTRIYNHHTLNGSRIVWKRTDNCSYENFFGRGKMHYRISDSNILILGIGAVGSVLATTLVRGGLKHITMVDYDVKEPDNVCRSEYEFYIGNARKIDELQVKLLRLSPFVNVYTNDKFINEAKLLNHTEQWIDVLNKSFSEFDLIFDCTTDNNIAYMLDQLDVKADIFSLSITNHARELVCAVSPRVYEATNAIYGQLNNKVDDLYNPTGCWSPTFRASYNDIAVLVQYAIKQINSNYIKDRPQRSFYLATCDDEGFQIKLKQL